jgi:hypothetical protein
MSISRQAYLEAADFIENNPSKYNFMHCYDSGCGTPLCMAGWVLHFAGMEPMAWGEASKVVFGCSATLFPWNAKEWTPDRMDVTRAIASSDNKSAARVLRAYADKYHPEPIAAIKKLLTGSEICEAIISLPYQETENALTKS